MAIARTAGYVSTYQEALSGCLLLPQYILEFCSEHSVTFSIFLHVIPGARNWWPVAILRYLDSGALRKFLICLTLTSDLTDVFRIPSSTFDKLSSRAQLAHATREGNLPSERTGQQKRSVRHFNGLISSRSFKRWTPVVRLPGIKDNRRCRSLESAYRISRTSFMRTLCTCLGPFCTVLV